MFFARLLKKYFVKRVKRFLFFLVTYRAQHTAVSGAGFMTPLIGQSELFCPLIGWEGLSDTPGCYLAVPDRTFLAGKFSLRAALKSASSGRKRQHL